MKYSLSIGVHLGLRVGNGIDVDTAGKNMIIDKQIRHHIAV